MSDESATDDEDGFCEGMYCFLVGRAIPGRFFCIDKKKTTPDQVVLYRTKANAGYQRALGGREYARGIYGAFTVCNAEKVCPAYVVIYRREADAPAQHMYCSDAA